MAQIIASIERMEQEQRRPASHADGFSGEQTDASRAQEQTDLSRQFRGKKGKKGKGSIAKLKAGKKLRVSAVPLNGMEPFERSLTPKKRWIQQWSAQMDTVRESPEDRLLGELEGKPEAQEEECQSVSISATHVVAASPVAEVKVAPSAPALDVATLKIAEKPVETSAATISSPTDSAAKVLTAPSPVIVEQSKLQAEQVAKMTNASTTPTSISGAAAAASIELRVKTPQNTESSHLSPPLERNSPSTTASISPSAKVKDSDTPNTSTAKFSPTVVTQESPVPTDKKQLMKKEARPPSLERKSSSSSSVGKGEEGLRRDRHDRSRKRSLERSEPTSEESKRRAERRRKRKSNWDVGDPRKGGSPVAPPEKTMTAAAAAANQQSFAKYPPNRPSWRHSQSMQDMKPHFQNGYRSSFYNSSSSSGRRGFHHSSSMPLDRSRSTGRSSTRYSYGSSSSSNNYR
ncbi:hypothetical protein PHYBOEH_003513 [Phytophthora boehmeriae]|uniref:Uncharacterized protein n=1 Tax=Phytophthora boehmeriae TaxID=109152 RepID=A0A8T1XA21_9STRA|nr:hypothetical protein PHYBOEH_003513 [Phytophthora boehmeriae]